MRTFLFHLFFLLVIAVLPCFGVSTPPPVPAKSTWGFDAGFDIRIRYDLSNNYIGGDRRTVTDTYTEHLRFRTRPWVSLKRRDTASGVYLRLNNEFRSYSNSTANRHTQEFPDELFLDNFYIDLKGVFNDRVNVRVGRQDIALGSHRVVCEGTPGDGGRSYFFDAINVEWKLWEKSRLNLIATWNTYRNWASIGNPYRESDMQMLYRGSPTYSKMDERGLIAFFQYRERTELPVDVYWIWKQDTRSYRGTLRCPGRQYQTLGVRIAPKFSDTVSAEFELAGQAGRVEAQGALPARPILAAMVFGGVTYERKDLRFRPSLSLNCLCLSGDKENYWNSASGRTDHSWNPVFNRTPCMSEMLCVSMYDNARWSNIVYPHLAFNLAPFDMHAVNATTGPMYAMQCDNGADDVYRGYYTSMRYQFPIFPKTFGPRHSLMCAFIGELMVYGDYYSHHGETCGTFFRVEFFYRF